MRDYANENYSLSHPKLFPAGLKFLDVAGLLNTLLISAGNWLTACLSDVCTGHLLWGQKWGECGKDSLLKKAAP